MADSSPKVPRSNVAESSTPAPEVALEVRQGTSPPAFYEIGKGGFLIGSVPGCDLRLPGSTLPPLFCSIALADGALAFRKLNATVPIQVNGKPTASAFLKNGDKLSFLGLEIVVRGQPAQQALPPSLEGIKDQLNQQMRAFKAGVQRFQQSRETAVKELKGREAKLKAAVADLESDRARWTQQRGEIEQECAQLKQAAEAPHVELEAKTQELASLQQELADLRTQLYDRYRERRDRLTALDDSVGKAARKVQERKRQVDEEQKQLEARKQEFQAEQAGWEAKRRALEGLQGAVESRERDLKYDLAQRLKEVQAREETFSAERIRLEEQQAQYQDDLVRLDRRQGAFDQRELELQKKTREYDERVEVMQRDTHDLEEQVKQLDEWHNRMCDLGERLAKQKAEQEETARQQAQRAAQLEGQQSTLAALRTRLEQMREEARRAEQNLSEQQARQETLETELQQRLEETRKLKEDLDRENQFRDSERKQFSERGTALDTAVSNLRQAQDKIAAEEERLKLRAAELDVQEAAHVEKASLLEGRLAQYEDLQRRLEAERESVLQRSRLLAQAEQAREALQEQLRRRSDELVQRQKAVADQQGQQEEALATVLARRSEIEQQHQGERAALDKLRKEIHQHRQDLDQHAQVVGEREGKLAELTKRLKEVGRGVAAERKRLIEERADLAARKQQAADEMAQTQVTFADTRREIKDLQRQVPELELKAGAALERLTHARELLGEHLAEVNNYARQCHDDLESLRGQVTVEADQVQQREQGLRRQQDEHRLAVAAFRQQLLDWQGQLAEMKRLLATDETRLQRRQVLVEKEERRIETDTQRLAREKEELIAEKQTVAEHRQEVDRHLEDMRDWYCRKLRELAGLRDIAPAQEATPASAGPRDILSLTGDLDPADRHLGELLKKMGLADNDTLNALWREARRQRRSLRQVLLASNVVTLYQLALIEAGNLDALMLGPVRVVDRVRATPREAVYRVFDPRRGQEAVLRHLAEAEMDDPLHPDEFRQRFTQAILKHPNLAAPVEVFDVAGRPAVLLDWLTGLSSPDWPPLAAAPGVCFRLIKQAALGLRALHEAGLAHGHLDASLILLTGEGHLKLAGVGEPLWLPQPPPLEAADDPAADLRALGKIAAGWCVTGPRKGAKVKALPPELLAVLDRLGGLDAADAFGSAGDLLEELDKINAAIPPNAEAWDRLIKHVRDHAAAGASLRLSA